MAIAGGIGILGAFLPWLSLSGEGAEFFKELLEADGQGLSGLGDGRDGNITIVLAIVAAVMGVIRLSGKAPNAAPITGIVMGAVISLTAIVDIADVSNRADELDEVSGYGAMMFGSVDLSVGIGLWLTLLAGIAITVTSILALRSNKAR